MIEHFGLTQAIQMKNLNNQSDLKIGDAMADGTVYAGISPTTGTKSDAMPHDSGVMTYPEALRFIQRLDYQYGFRGSSQVTCEALENPSIDDGGWRLSSYQELLTLHANKLEIGNFHDQNGGSENWDLALGTVLCDEDEGPPEAYVHAVEFQRDRDMLGWARFNSPCHVRFIRTEPRPKP